MEEIAARAGVGVGTVYRRFASKDALIDELLRVVLEEILSAAERALARADGHGLEELLRALGQSFADHARYASLLLARHTDNAAVHRIRAAIDELTTRARAAGTVNPGITASDVLVLVWAMRGLVQAAGEAAPEAWQRFLDIQLAGMRATGPLSSTPPLSSRQLPELALPTSALRPAGQAGLGLTVGSGRAVLAGIVLVPDVTGKRTHVRTQGQRQQRHACHLFESDGIFYCVERIMAPGEGTVARG
jgi:AcrR family transcriptional regulator